MYARWERTALIGLGMPTIFLRFGKALVMLIFFYYALEFTDNELWIGIAFGITALVQAVLTIPFGFWSDKYGRKKMIIIGLIFFIIGSILAANPFDNIFILIFARLLQGVSAIYSSVLAFISDVIPEKKRSRTMGLFSIFTGIVFSMGIIIGPTISPVFLPYSFLFILSAILGFIALIYLIVFVPEPELSSIKKEPKEKIKKPSNSVILKDAFFNRRLLKIYITTFLSNFVLVSILFLLVPILLEGFFSSELVGLILIPIFILGMLVMMAASVFADKGFKKPVIVSSFVLVGFGLTMFFIYDLVIIVTGLALFFIGMAIIDPLLPTLILMIAPKTAKGTASGAYNLMRYLGEGIGPIIAGLILLMFNINILLFILFILTIFSLILISSVKFKIR